MVSLTTALDGGPLLYVTAKVIAPIAFQSPEPTKWVVPLTASENDATDKVKSTVLS
jgi:hypothetical protein